MEKFEREQRLNSAAELLLALVMAGCSLRYVAAFLGVNPVTLSLWRRVEAKSKVATPTDQQLQRLVALLSYQLSEGLKQAQLCCEACSPRREGALLLYALGLVLEEVQAAHQKQMADQLKLAATTHDFRLAVGPQNARKVLRLMPDSEPPSPDTSSWAEASARAAADTAAEFDALKVTREDAAQARQDLEQLREAYSERQRRKMSKKAPRKKRKKKRTYAK